MKRSPESSLRGFCKVIVAGTMLCGVSIAQSSPEPPKGNKQLTDQTILFNPVPAQSASKTVSLEATASSGLPVTFRSTTPAICTVRKSAVSPHRDGICIVQALQAGNGLYAAVSTITQSFAVKSATRCCRLFDIAQDGTIAQLAAQAREPAFCPTPEFAPESPLTPDTWVPGTTVQITVKGAGFTTAAEATKSCPATVITAEMNGNSVALSNVTVLNSTTITATAKVSADLPGGLVNVLLWGPDISAKDVNPSTPSVPKQ
jgi:hypothetical protein